MLDEVRIMEKYYKTRLAIVCKNLGKQEMHIRFPQEIDNNVTNYFFWIQFFIYHFFVRFVVYSSLEALFYIQKANIENNKKKRNDKSVT